MAIDTMDKLVKALAESTKCRFYKPSISNTAAGVLIAMWRSAGFPMQGAIPTTAATPTSATDGAWALPTPGSGEKMYLGKLAASLTVAGQLMIFDRLAHMGGLSGTVTTAQTVDLDIATAASQGRCAADGSDVLWCWEWYADTGSTGQTISATYTNNQDQSGRASQSTSLPATRRAGMCYPILPNVADKFIKSVQTTTLSGTTGTAGNFGVTARKRLAEMPFPLANVGGIADFADLAMQEIQSNSCLELVILVTGTSTGNALGGFDILVG